MAVVVLLLCICQDGLRTAIARARSPAACVRSLFRCVL